jgi:nucleotide-binding universal stress UspA family protein
MTVVAGVDGSPVSELVVTRAVEQAQWRETDLHLVFVSYMPMIYTEAVIDWDQVLEAQRESVWSKLAGIIGDADVEVRQVDLDGYPPDYTGWLRERRRGSSARRGDPRSRRARFSDPGEYKPSSHSPGAVRRASRQSP